MLNISYFHSKVLNEVEYVSTSGSGTPFLGPALIQMLAARPAAKITKTF